MGDVDDLRFIVLSLKNSIINNINETSDFYSGSPLNCNPSNIVFLSKHIKLHNESPLIKCTHRVFTKLFESPVDSKDVISIVAEQPLGYKLSLNATRSAVLCQPFG